MKTKKRFRWLMMLIVAGGATAMAWLPNPQPQVSSPNEEPTDETIVETTPDIEAFVPEEQAPADLFEVAIDAPPVQVAAVSEPVDSSDVEPAIVPTAGTLPAKDRASRSGITQQQLDDVTLLIDEGKIVEAHEKLSAWYWNHTQDRPRFQEQLEKLAKSIYFSPQPHYEEAYVIQSGDQLRKIARKYKLSWKYLARLNRVNPRKIRVGQKLKVVQGPFDAVVDLSDFELTIVKNGQFVRSYRVGIGKDGSSPIGKFKVKDKLEDPTYYGPDGVIANDDPENPLGERWIDIGDSFGIHGTIDPDSIGKSESRGCVRMLNDDVEEVYDFLTVGSTVWIRP